jgi:hypothetical protein
MLPPLMILDLGEEERRDNNGTKESHGRGNFG